jgi:hypothetical protein
MSAPASKADIGKGIGPMTESHRDKVAVISGAARGWSTVRSLPYSSKPSAIGICQLQHGFAISDIGSNVAEDCSSSSALY